MTSISKLEVFIYAEQLCNINKNDLEKSFYNKCKSHIKPHKDAEPININNLYLMIQLKLL